jgi:hypothetical protein
LVPFNSNDVPALYKESEKPFVIYLTYCQEATMGVMVSLDLSGHGKEGDCILRRKHGQLSWLSKEWVEGEGVRLTNFRST